ncbi:MAG: hypoxanthine phosphoribosyltransferase [Bacteroidetes bacterium]|nr:hypoxanthine phosphoribosyltransferase [Bacteroidota bacterium]
MKTITVKDKHFALSIDSSEILKSVEQVAIKINSDYKNDIPLFIVILNGSFMFAADLFKKIDMPCEISFMKLSSYQGMETSNTVKTLIGLNEEIKGRKVVIVEDIIDTGITIENLIEQIKIYEPEDIKIATLLFKPNAFQKDFKIDYIGIEIPNDFIVGYGLDYDGFGRNLADIYKVVS